jgi:hypothetical protein
MDEVPWDVIAGIIESSATGVTRDTNHISFDGEAGRTSVTVRPIALKSPVQKKLVAVITVETKLPRLPLPEARRLTAALNMASALSALVQDNDGNWKMVSRLSFYEGDYERREVYVGLVAFGALLHATALSHSLGEISKVPDQRPPLNLPHGSEASRWLGDEFNQARNLFRERGVFATASDNGFTAEFPWDEGACVALIKPGTDVDLTDFGAYTAVNIHYRELASELGMALDEAQAAYWRGAEVATREQMRTSLLQLTTREAHPRIGNGLFCRLELPVNMSDESANETASQLNLLDYAAVDSPPFFGSWCSASQSGRVTYVSFWPNLLFHSGTAAMASSWMERRSAQAHQWITKPTPSAGQQGFLDT